MNTTQGESESLPQPQSALLLGLMPTAASPRRKADCGLSSRYPPCSGSPHQRPALVHPQLSSLPGLAASAASPSPPAIILPQQQIAFILGLMPSAASPRKKAICCYPPAIHAQSTRNPRTIHPSQPSRDK